MFVLMGVQQMAFTSAFTWYFLMSYLVARLDLAASPSKVLESRSTYCESEWSHITVV